MLLALAFIIIVLCAIEADEVADVLRGLWGVVEFFSDVLYIAAGTILKVLWYLLFHAARLSGRGIRLGLIFLFYFLVELLRGDRAATEEDEDEAAEAEQDEDELCAAARTLLGLPDDFTRAALDAAYKRAIRKAHPDASGSVDEAQAVNMARELLLRRLATA